LPSLEKVRGAYPTGLGQLVINHYQVLYSKKS